MTEGGRGLTGRHTHISLVELDCFQLSSYAIEALSSHCNSSIVDDISQFLRLSAAVVKQIGASIAFAPQLRDLANYDDATHRSSPTCHVSLALGGCEIWGIARGDCLTQRSIRDSNLAEVNLDWN